MEPAGACAAGTPSRCSAVAACQRPGCACAELSWERCPVRCAVQLIILLDLVYSVNEWLLERERCAFTLVSATVLLICGSLVGIGFLYNVRSWLPAPACSLGARGRIRLVWKQQAVTAGLGMHQAAGIERCRAS